MKNVLKSLWQGRLSVKDMFIHSCTYRVPGTVVYSSALWCEAVVGDKSQSDDHTHTCKMHPVINAERRGTWAHENKELGNVS